MRKLFLWIIILVINISFAGCRNLSATSQNKEIKQNIEITQQPDKSALEDNSTVYKNAQYGFNFKLPESWKDYKIITDKWEGLSIGETQGEKVVETGPLISIRHPEWTEKDPRQDIPVMVFTLNQWDSLQKDKFHIGAAPIGPIELARNNKYVFALPARYNFAFPKGYEEVENILNNKPLQTSDL